MRTSLFPVLCLTLLPLFSQAAYHKVTLLDALKNQQVSITASNINGHYCGLSTRITVTSKSADDLGVIINPAIILKPQDTSYQPMVLAGTEFVVLPAGEERSVNVKTFCGDCPRHCPNEGAVYTFSHWGGDTLAQVLQFLKSNNVGDFTGQDAVWVITNNEPVGNVYTDNEKLQERLIALLCRFTGQKQPDYYTVNSHNEQPGQPAYVPKPLKIIANFQLLLDAPKTLTLGIYNDKNEMMQKVFENQELKAGGHNMKIEFESTDVPAGKYFIRLKEQQMVLKEKMVEVK